MKKEIRKILKKYNAKKIEFFWFDEEDPLELGYLDKTKEITIASGRTDYRKYRTKKFCNLIVGFVVGGKFFQYEILSERDFLNNIECILKN